MFHSWNSKPPGKKSKKERHESCPQVIDSNLMLSMSATVFESRDFFDYLGQTNTLKKYIK